MANYYTADMHFGDRARWLDRPSVDPGLMADIILGKMNATVGIEDDLWILGDFSYGEKSNSPGFLSSIFSRLPGRRKHLVLGNHDTGHVLDLGWSSISSIAEIEEDGHALVLCHYPMLAWNGMGDGAVHLFGHVHESSPGYRGAVNVGVDMWDYRPASLSEILKRRKHLPSRPAVPSGAAETA